MIAKSIWLWAALLIALPAVSAEKSIPEWLRGRASDTNPGPRIETAASIEALCQRPRDISELLRNLNLIWERKLLTQPAFFHDKALMCFLGGTSVTWKKGSVGTVDTYRRPVTIRLDENIFPHATIDAQISRLNKPAVPGLPAHVQYIGILSLHIDGTSSLKFRDVQGFFGSSFHQLSANELSPHGSPVAAPGKVFVFYLYPGDDSEKYGAVELPQIRFLLKQGDVAPSQMRRYEPQDSDLIASIFVREHANRK